MVKNGILLLLAAISLGFAQQNPSNQNRIEAKGVYIITFRTPGHVRSSSPEIFHSAAADIRKMLTDEGVLIAQDKERGFIENESQMSMETMTALAREAGAGSLLFVTVDRPTSKWIKLVLTTYDLDGKLIWEESVDSGMSGWSGASGYKKCFEKLKKVLLPRIGSAGLPLSAGGFKAEVKP
jgi:hypothetical protein